MISAFEVRNLSFRYHKNQPNVVENINLTIPSGTIFGLLGPSGAGKSTTQKILSKLLTTYQGTIAYFGEDLKHLGKQFYETVGVGFEMPVLFNKLTAGENLAYFSSLYQTQADYKALMTRVGLIDAIDQPVGQYSKGMKTRLNFVRALLNDPKMLFLDEPTNGLDPANARIVKDIIKEQKAAGKTILITTHLMGDVEELCDEVAFIDKGHLLEVSTPKALKLKYGQREVKVEYTTQDELSSLTLPLDGLGTNPQFSDILNHHRIITIHSAETTMDNIFIQIVGEKKHE